MANIFDLDLETFKVVPPNRDVRVDDLTMPDGTPLTGPDGLLIPAARNFAMVVNSATRVYSYRMDEAMRDNFVAARAMRRDAFLLGLLEERILPTINREWTLEVDDDRDPEQQYVRDGLSRIVKSIKNFDAMKRALLDAVWFGRAGVGWAFARQEEVDNLWGLGKWDPVHGDSVQFSFDGHPCILMDAQTAGWYSSHGAKYGPPGVGDLVPTDRGGTALQLHRPTWRERYAIHQHILQKADYFEGEMAGSVQGLGIRGQVYWHYVVRSDALTWMLAYMQAVGQMDLLVFNYPAGNAAAEARAIQNAQKVIGKAAIACPRSPTQNWPAVEQIPMNSAGLQALQKLVADYFDRHIERLIVGQSMSSGADKGTGLGGTGRAQFAQATKDEILVYDCNRLDQTLTHDLIKPLKKYNFPWAKFPVRFKSVLPDLEAQEKVMSGKVLVSLGIPIKADELRNAAGYGRPEPGDDVVGAPQQGPGGPGGPLGAPPGPGGAPGQPAPSWMGASGGPPGGAPMLPPGPGGPQMLAHGRYPVSYIRPSSKLADERWLEPLTREVEKLSKQDLDGIKVDVNTLTKDIRVDVMDWGDPKIGKKLVAAAKRCSGVGRVEELNEASKPFGKGWSSLYERNAPAPYMGMGFPGGSNTHVPKYFGAKNPDNPNHYQLGSHPTNYDHLPYKKCNTQVQLVGESQMRVLQASSGIPDTHLADKGRELDAHITIRYGLDECDPREVAKLVGRFGPIKFRLTRASVFPASEDKPYDVLKFEVVSSDLERLNRILKTLPGTDGYPVYKPHATVCYLQPGLGQVYAARTPPLNLDVTVDGFMFCGRDGNKTWISTSGKPAGPVMTDNRDNPEDVRKYYPPGVKYARPRQYAQIPNTATMTDVEQPPNWHDPNPEPNRRDETWRGPERPTGAVDSPQDESGRPLENNPATNPDPPREAPQTATQALDRHPAPVSVDFSSPEAFAESVGIAAGYYGADDEESVARAQAAQEVARRIPRLVYERISERISGIVSHPDPESVASAWTAATGKDAYDPDFGNPEGFYDPGTGEIAMNGVDPAGVFAHEMGHAIDTSAVGGGSYDQLSTTPEWQKAFRVELASGALSDYAALDPAEAFGEFCRLVYATPDGQAVAERSFPLCYRFFASYGLI